MRRFIVMFLSVVALLGALVVGGGALAAQDTEMADHPLVGTWLLVDSEDPDGPPALVVFTSDGIYLQTDYDRQTGYGSWEATDPTSAAMTFVQQFPDDEGNFGGSAIIRAAIEVDADGQRFTASYSIEVGGEDGPAGEFGPGEVIATRLAVEPMGTPVGTLDILFGGEEGGTPEATPVP